MADTHDSGIGGRFTPRSTWRWPIVFRSLGQSIQETRLGVALIAFVIFMACGSLWDALSPVQIDPLERPQPVLNAVNFTMVHAKALNEADRERLLEEESLTYAEAKAAIAKRYHARKDQAQLELLEARDAEHRAQILERLETHELAARASMHRLEIEQPRGVFQHTIRSLSGLGSDFIASLWTLDHTRAWEGTQALWNGLGERFTMLWREHTAFSIVFGLLTILLFCLAGGAICRLTALDLAEGKAQRATHGIGFALARLRDLLLSLLFFPIVALVLCVIVAIGWGIMLRFPGLNIFGALLYFLALICGLLIVLIGVGFVGCFSLMVPAIAVEQTDGYDAQQRAYAYLLARPGHLLLYTLLALIQGAVALTLIWFIALATLNLTADLASLLGGEGVGEMAGGWDRLLEERPLWMLSGTERVAASLIGIWRAVLAALVAAFIISFYFTSQTIIYFLMRWSVDGEAIERSDLSGAAV